MQLFNNSLNQIRISEDVIFPARSDNAVGVPLNTDLGELLLLTPKKVILFYAW